MYVNKSDIKRLVASLSGEDYHESTARICSGAQCRGAGRTEVPASTKKVSASGSWISILTSKPEKASFLGMKAGTWMI